MKNKRSLKIGLLCITSISLSSCQLMQENEERDRRIFAMQTRVFQLEKRFNKENEAAAKSGENLSLSLAESQNQQEEVQKEIQTLKGEVQLLRHFTGVGDLSPENLEAKKLDNRLLSLEKQVNKLPAIEAKIAHLDQMQNEILNKMEDLVKTMSSQKTRAAKSSASLSGSREPLNSLSEVEKAYNEKRYLHIIEDYDRLKSKVGTKDKFELGYLHSQSLFRLGRISEAALSFDTLLKIKDLGAKASKVYLRLGDCFRLLGDNKMALIYYEELVNKYPKSAEVTSAQQYLEELKANKI